ncbi:hypothetical protein [Arabiibacter massiliensis]|uniref:hypothetical protein n=1 Tax=Arabiibacter massiliensis TaxID=1870985 RepID=UPI0009BBC9D4|nr:hypothetical protein [Arabiibacter massiliensis]
MDAYEIAKLVANQDPANPVRLRFGVVASMGEEALLVVPDGEAVAVPAVRCCHPAVGDRVVVVADASEWLAVAAVGGDHVDTSELSRLQARVAELEHDTGWVNIYYVNTANSKIDIKARRVGRTVTVTGVSGNYYNVGESTYHEVTRLDEEFRPSYTVPFTFNFMGGDPAGQSSYIEPDGLIRMYAVGSNRTYWNFSVSYVV